MKLLAIDTVTEMCSVALQVDDQTFVREELARQKHTQFILGMIEDVLSESQTALDNLDAIAFSRGPGSFTGLRICASVTQGLALAYDLPVVPVSSLQILAQGAYREAGQAAVMACIDARKNEVYSACFQELNGVLELVGQEQVAAPGSVVTPDNKSWYGVGSGFLSYESELNDNPEVRIFEFNAQRYPLARDIIPKAKQLVLEQKMLDASLALPVYLRDNIASPSPR